MVKSMFSGVAGLKTHQAKMDVIGNNIANVNTWGFKAGSMSPLRIRCIRTLPPVQPETRMQEATAAQMQIRLVTA